MVRHLCVWLILVASIGVAAPVSARFLSIDPIPADAARATRHGYADGDPMRRIDPDGRQSMAWIAAHGPPSPPGEASAYAVARHDGSLAALRLLGRVFLSQFSDGPGGFASSPASLLRGIRSEARILQALGETKNTHVIATPHGRTIPDFANATQVGEIKDAKRVAMSPQLRAQIDHARETGRAHVVVTGTRTHVTKPVEDATQVIRRDDLGPPP